jgi:Tol biopolymer transport system component
MKKHRRRSLLFSVWVLAVASVVAGCGSSEPKPPGSAVNVGSDHSIGATPPTVTTVPLEAGDTRFLLGQQNIIETVTLSGGEARLIQLDDGVNVLAMALSPDRSRLAFVVELPAYAKEDGSIDFGTDLYVSDADGSNAHRVLEHMSTGEYFEAPAWLDDSTLLVGTRGSDPVTGSYSRIEKVDIAKSTRTVVLDNAAMGAISPDGKSIAYTAIDPQTRVQHLVIENLTTDDQPRILVDEYAGLALFSAVTFSPDGSELAFAAVDLGTIPPPPMPASRSDAVWKGAVQTLTHPFAEDAWVINPSDATGLHRMADMGENMPSLTWSGDSAWVYALGPGFLWRLDPAASTGEQLRQSTGAGAILWLEGK